MKNSLMCCDPVTTILEQLDGARSAGKDRWAARCPAHHDHKASLSVKLGNDGRVLLYCHAGCRIDEICAALGVKQADLFDGKTDSGSGTRRIAATYDYEDEKGNLLLKTLDGIQTFNAGEVSLRLAK